MILVILDPFHQNGSNCQYRVS